MKKRIDYWKDGDSGKFTDGNHFRLARVRAPEKYQFGGEQATQRLRRQIQGKVVTLRPVGRSYSRVVAKVRCNRKIIR